VRLGATPCASVDDMVASLASGLESEGD
jgi:hypothetical protein